MTMLASLAGLLEPWATVYGNAPALQVATAFAHFGGFLLGGGFAIVADAATLRVARRRYAWRRRQLARIHGAHRIVLAGLALTVLSGLLMAAADLETLAASPQFWVKMAIVALLLVNGGVMAATESALRARETDQEQGWRRLARVAALSLALWFAAVLAGTTLVTV